MKITQALFTWFFTGLIVFISSFIIPDKFLFTITIAVLSALIGGLIAIKFIK